VITFNREEMEQVNLPDGYTMRPGSVDDLPGIVAVANARSQMLRGEDEFTEEVMGNDWNQPGFEVERDVRVVLNSDGRIVGMIESWNNAAPHVRPSVWGCVHPDFYNKGIGTALLRWAEAHFRKQLHLAPPEAQIVMTCHINAQEEQGHAVFRGFGMEPLRYYFRMEIEMETPPLAPEWPKGITVRSLRPDENEREAFRVIRESFRDHWGHVEGSFEEDFARWDGLRLTHPDYDPALRFVAMDGENVIGASLCMPTAHDDDTMGLLETLGVLRPYRNRGIAKALLLHTFGAFYRRGKKRVGLGVDVDNPTGALGLYENAGMRPTREFVHYGKELRPGIDLTAQHDYKD